jgi:hypothetical protein
VSTFLRILEQSDVAKVCVTLIVIALIGGILYVKDQE